MKTKTLFSLTLVTAMALQTAAVTNVFAVEPYAPGYTVEPNTDFTATTPDADYQVTFVFEDSDTKNAVDVQLTGGFQFYKPEEVVGFVGFEDNSFIPSYSAQEYEDGMFAAGYDINANTTLNYAMSETSEERFEVTIPLDGNLYYYDYIVTYDDDTSIKIQDPANLSDFNSFNDHDAGHSYAYVGDSNHTASGQEYIYARGDDQTGTIQYDTYIAQDDSIQPLGIYLPAGYDETKTYKTLYLSHGGGGNEAEWMTIGAVGNIMDNLIASGGVEDTIVVTMDNSYFGWNYENIIDNVMNHIIPYMEANYSVATDASSRAFSGLSMGGRTTSAVMQAVTDQFGYYGIFSNGTEDENPDNWDAAALNDVTIYMAAGSIDTGWNRTVSPAGPGFPPCSAVGLMTMLDGLEVDYSFDLLNGAHDWYVWREAVSIFARDYLWRVAAAEEPVVEETTETPVTEAPSTIVETSDSSDIASYLLGAVVAVAGLAYYHKRNKQEA